jgi:hypothetical protein
MDFSHIGFDKLWSAETHMRSDSKTATAYAVLFAWFASNLIFSIVRTICSSPGTIPDDREWDMATETEISGDEDIQALLPEPKRQP